MHMRDIHSVQNIQYTTETLTLRNTVALQGLRSHVTVSSASLVASGHRAASQKKIIMESSGKFTTQPLEEDFFFF